MNDVLTRIGLALRKRREGLKLTQEEFAANNGMNSSYYGSIERGRQNLTLLNLTRLADGLNTPLSQILREAEKLDLERALEEPSNPPRRGRPPGKKSRWR
jgi:transcriptional regulator with XRE-family HTH domain